MARENGERSRKISHAAVSRNEVAREREREKERRRERERERERERGRGAEGAANRCTACAPFLLDFSKPIERSRSREQHA